MSAELFGCAVLAWLGPARPHPAPNALPRQTPAPTLDHRYRMRRHWRTTSLRAADPQIDGRQTARTGL
ncbi:hypothetical protein LB506_000992 [Fusarium annulatum]|nr:hypothetical protein LB506_000992 [Fusarium annulatum]